MTIIKLMFILLFRYDLLLRYLDDELMQDLEHNEPKIITFQCDWEAGLTERMKEEARAFTEANYSLLYKDEYRSAYLRNE